MVQEQFYWGILCENLKIIIVLELGFLIYELLLLLMLIFRSEYTLFLLQKHCQELHIKFLSGSLSSMFIIQEKHLASITKDIKLTANSDFTSSVDECRFPWILKIDASGDEWVLIWKPPSPKFRKWIYLTWLERALFKFK